MRLDVFSFHRKRYIFDFFFTKKRHFKVEKGATCEPALHCQITGTLSDLVTR